MRFPPSNLLATLSGFLLMMIALECACVTIARGGYAGALLASAAFAALAMVFLALPFIRGPIGWRIAALALALPSLFIASEFIRRAPRILGGG